MLRLQTTLNQANAFAARLLSDTGVCKEYAKISVSNRPVTEKCIPQRRRRARRNLATGSGEVLRSTWF